MSSHMPESFYRLLYFSPRPEDDERVCVGIVVHDGKRTFVDYDDKLEKAHCFAPDYTKESLTFILQTMQENAGRIALEGKLFEFSPQFRISGPRALLRPVDEAARAVLRDRYLLKPKSPDHKKREKGVERRIDHFLRQNLRLPGSLIRRKASVEEILGLEVSRELPKELIPKPVSRALIADSNVCLVDGVDLHVVSMDLLVHRVSRVAHTFWQYDRMKQMLLNFGHRRVVRAAVIFDGDGTQAEPSLKWREDYAVHEFEKDADITVKAGSPEQESAMLNKLRAFLPPNTLNLTE